VSVSLSAESRSWEDTTGLVEALEVTSVFNEGLCKRRKTKIRDRTEIMAKSNKFTGKERIVTGFLAAILGFLSLGLSRTHGDN